MTCPPFACEKSSTLVTRPKSAEDHFVIIEPPDAALWKTSVRVIHYCYNNYFRGVLRGIEIMSVWYIISFSNEIVTRLDRASFWMVNIPTHESTKNYISSKLPSLVVIRSFALSNLCQDVPARRLGSGLERSGPFAQPALS